MRWDKNYRNLILFSLREIRGQFIKTSLEYIAWIFLILEQILMTYQVE